MKQIKKMSLSNIISNLTRNEMRNIMAGSGSGSHTCLCNGSDNSSTTVSSCGTSDCRNFCAGIDTTVKSCS